MLAGILSSRDAKDAACKGPEASWLAELQSSGTAPVATRVPASPLRLDLLRDGKSVAWTAGRILKISIIWLQRSKKKIICRRLHIPLKQLAPGLGLMPNRQ